MQLDFSEMQHRLDKVGSKKVTSVYKDLGFCDKYDIVGFDNDKCIRLALLLSDSKSPILSIPSYDGMRKVALEAAGFENKGDKFSDKLYALMDGENESFNEMITEIFRLYNNHLYELWYTLKANFHTINTVLRQKPNIDSTDKLIVEQKNRAGLQAQLKEMTNELLKMEAKLFQNPYSRKAILSTTAQKMRNWPEEMATSGGVI